MTVQRGEVYFVDLNPVQGREQAGVRPVLVVSSDDVNRLPLVVTVVVGTKGANVSRDFKTNVRLPPRETGLPMETLFLCFQLRSLDSGRFPPQPAGRLSPSAMARIEAALRHCLDLKDPTERVPR
jgi:mRNA interferase MazF